MTFPAIEGTGTVDAAKYHLYVRLAATKQADYEKITIDAVLAASSHFKKVETGMEAIVAKGDEIKIITGTKIVISGENSGNFRLLGLTSVDYKAIMNQAAGYQNQDVDIFLLKAPTAQTSGTATVGQSLFQIYAVNVFATPEVKDSVPFALNLSYSRTDEASELGIELDTVVIDT